MKTTEEDLRAILIQLIAGASLCDHMADMWRDLTWAGRAAGLPHFEPRDYDSLARWAQAQGITRDKNGFLWDEE